MKMIENQIDCFCSMRIHPSPDASPERSGKGLRVRQFRAARQYGGRGAYSMMSSMTRPILPRPVSRDCDTEVHTRCDVTNGEPIAVDADAFVAGLGAKLAQRIPSGAQCTAAR